MEQDSASIEATGAERPDDGTLAVERSAPRRPAGPTGARKWLFRLIAMTAVPAAFFLLLELALRLFGYGYATGFFAAVPGSSDVTCNQRFAWRFFPPTGSKAPLPFRIAGKKPPRTIRIFVFGGSAAMGSPEPAFSFSRILRAMLIDRHPDVRFELVNAAMEGMSSHVARAVALDARKYEPDLFVVYIGNNDVVGPYGISDAFTQFSPNLTAIRASIWIKGTRTGQLVGSAIRGLGGARPRVWRGMETFVGGYVEADDPRLNRTFEHLGANVRDILAAARESGARSVLCTVATNLRDCAPFMSHHRRDLSARDLARWKELNKAGVVAALGARHAEAIRHFRAAEKIDARFADLHYLLARSLLAAGEPAEARRHFVLARDLDVLRVRADSAVARVLRGEAKHADGFVDVEKRFAQRPNSPHGLPGLDLFLDHCHMNDEGNYLIAAALLPEVTKLLAHKLPGGCGAATAPVEPPSRSRCLERLPLTGWDRYKIARIIVKQVSRPPFTSQLDNAERVAYWRGEVKRHRKFTLPEAGDEALATYRQAMKRRPDDLALRSNYALCLYGFGDHAGAGEQWRKLIQQLPGSAEYEKQLGVTLLQQGRFDEATGHFEASLAILPRDLNARNNLGAALLWKGEAKKAMPCFREVLAANPAHHDARTNLAIALARGGKLKEAEEQFAKVLAAEPDHVGALRNLAKLLSRRNRTGEAIRYYHKALEASEEAAVHLDLGGLLETQRRRGEAMPHYRRAVELAPTNARAHLMLGQALLAEKDPRGAAHHLTEAVRLNDELAGGHRDLGIALERLGRRPEAAGHYAKAVSLREGDWQTRERLAYALLVQRKYREAAEHYEKVLAVQPRRAGAHTNAGVALSKVGREREAILHFAAAVKLEPTALRHYNLATRLVRIGRDGDAAVQFRLALAKRPTWPEAMSELAWVLATSDEADLRDGKEALRLAGWACKLTKNKQPDMLDALAAAQAELGQFDDAVATARSARSLALGIGHRQMADRIAKRIALYKLRKPCRRGAREMKPAS